MQSENFRALIKPRATVHRIIWLAYIGAVPGYVVYAYLHFYLVAPSVTQPVPILFTILLVILSLVTALLAIYVPRRLVRDSKLRQLLDRPPDPKANISPEEQRLLALVGYLFVGFVVRLAFDEAIALYGLVLALISGSFVTVLPYAVVSFALIWMVPLPLDEALKRIASLSVQQGGTPTQPR
jgi:hypothetical protein